MFFSSSNYTMTTRTTRRQNYSVQDMILWWIGLKWIVFLREQSASECIIQHLFSKINWAHQYHHLPHNPVPTPSPLLHLAPFRSSHRRQRHSAAESWTACLPAASQVIRESKIAIRKFVDSSSWACQLHTYETKDDTRPALCVPRPSGLPPAPHADPGRNKLQKNRRFTEPVFSRANLP